MSEPKIIGRTTQCVRCGKKARMFTGHVLTKKREDVIAGWCSNRCHNILYTLKLKGCYGMHSEAMGLQDNPR